MIHTTRFVIAHVPKTGGTWMRKVFVAHAPQHWNVSAWHPGHYSLMRADRRLPAIAFVRNPWDWHVSRWAYWLKQYAKRHEFFLGPRERWRPMVRDIERVILKAKGDFGSFARDIVELEYSEQGYYERICLEPGTGKDMCRFGKFESLRSDLLDFVVEHAPGAPQPLRDAIAQAPPDNASTHKHYREYYDQDLREFVQRLDAPMIERFEYSF